MDDYRVWLFDRGYSSWTVRGMLKDLGQVGPWLAVEGLGVAELDEVRLAEFRAFRRESGYRRVAGPRALLPLLRFLREIGVTPAASRSTGPLDVLVGRNRVWMVEERGLAAATVLRYEKTARRFLPEQATGPDGLAPEGLTGADVTRSCCASALQLPG